MKSIDDEINEFLAGKITDPLEQVRVLKGWVRQLSEQNLRLAAEVDKARALARLLKELAS